MLYVFMKTATCWVWVASHECHMSPLSPLSLCYCDELHFYYMIKLWSEDKQLSSLFMRCNMDFGDMKIKPNYMIFFKTCITELTTKIASRQVRSLNNQIRNSPVRYFWQCKYIYESKMVTMTTMVKWSLLWLKSTKIKIKFQPGRCMSMHFFASFMCKTGL